MKTKVITSIVTTLTQKEHQILFGILKRFYQQHSDVEAAKEEIAFIKDYYGQHKIDITKIPANRMP